MYKARLSKKQMDQWESFKLNIMVDRKQRIFRDSAFLGNCSVNISFIDGELALEVMPNETANIDGDVEGVIVNIDEDTCHLDSILKMALNSQQVKRAKKNNKPIKHFNAEGGIKIY